ncbi:hypothetical protein ANN_14199 [Periplaneta americana]|uniref:Uncharacterized protein n=1 Tax=Periplaneta americana TaxID=6978 RepID=A0ABQ8SX29_PERAM|nr:hypothetical protein ANN_14199 [Periplaneta americana]
MANDTTYLDFIEPSLSKTRKIRSGAGDRTRFFGTTYQALSPLSYAEVQSSAPDRTALLQTFFVDQLLPESVFQQHGAPPHYNEAVRGFLNANFPNSLIGRGEPLPGDLGQPT